MMYHGKLYGKLFGKYFDTDHTTDEWDSMEKQIKELKAENEALKQANGVSTAEMNNNNENSELNNPAISNCNRRNCKNIKCTVDDCPFVLNDDILCPLA